MMNLKIYCISILSAFTSTLYSSSNEEVVQLYNNKIFGVDSSIKKGKYGEVLIIKNKRFFRGTLNGKLIELVSENQ